LQWFSSNGSIQGCRKYRVWAATSPASYSGDSKFKSWPGNQPSQLRFFVVYSVLPGKWRDSNLIWAMIASLSDSSQFIIH
jgi:hypothetical protein